MVTRLTFLQKKHSLLSSRSSFANAYTDGIDFLEENDTFGLGEDEGEEGIIDFRLFVPSMTTDKGHRRPRSAGSSGLLHWFSQHQICKELTRTNGENELILSAERIFPSPALTATPLAFIILATALKPPVYELSTKDTLTPSLRISDWTYPAKFVYLSYLDPTTGLYLKGPDDVFVVVFWIFMWIFLRAILMRYFWSPLARCCGIKRESQVVRFAEQGWSLAYWGVFWALGFVSFSLSLPNYLLYSVESWMIAQSQYIMQSSPYRNLRTEHFYIGYPHIQLKPLTKWYYLVQTSFWFSQIVVLNIEKKRKDHAQMFTHHIITSILIVLSLIFNFTRIGNAILCLMDFCDIFFALAKMLRYVGLQKLCDATFGFFVIAWIVTRHILYNYITYSLAKATEYAPYHWDPPAGSFWTKEWQFNFIALLLSLQVLMCIWFAMILKVVYRVLTGKTATDTRSDTEEDDDKYVKH
jgi:acyl-CoA-dependent ceramide synthase